jgi:hypothetical protein
VSKEWTDIARKVLGFSLSFEQKFNSSSRPLWRHSRS